MMITEIEYVESLIIDDGLPLWIDDLYDHDYYENEARIQEYLYEQACIQNIITHEPCREGG